MKRLIIFTGLLLFSGCGAAHSEQDRTGERAAKEAVSPSVSPEDPSAEKGDLAEDRSAETGGDLLGVWEKASCGDRKYVRRVTFKKEGNFTAVDEVAPCPEQGNCVSSGILHWEGTWSKNEETIDLEITPKDGAKLPEEIPATFVILRPDPISIGERDKHLVCPYQKR